jgi:hypothetical protein
MSAISLSSTTSSKRLAEEDDDTEADGEADVSGLSGTSGGSVESESEVVEKVKGRGKAGMRRRRSMML